MVNPIESSLKQKMQWTYLSELLKGVGAELFVLGTDQKSISIKDVVQAWGPSNLE